MSTKSRWKFVTQSVTRKSYRFKSIRSGKRCNGTRGLFFTPKNTKSPTKSRTFVLGCKIVAPLWLPLPSLSQTTRSQASAIPLFARRWGVGIKSDEGKKAKRKPRRLPKPLNPTTRSRCSLISAQAHLPLFLALLGEGALA